MREDLSMKAIVSLHMVTCVAALTVIFATACFDSDEQSTPEEEENEQKDEKGSENGSSGSMENDNAGGDREGSEPGGAAGEGGSESKTPDTTYDEDSIRCEDDGYCYYPDGHFCDPDGMCCYADGSCVREEVEDETDDLPVNPFGLFGPRTGSPIDPSDMTDEPWAPPIDDLGEPFFENSDDTLCTGYQSDGYNNSVWSDSRGVYVLASGFGNGEYHYEYPESQEDVPASPFYSGMEICVGEGCPSGKIFFNDGNGWKVVFEHEQTMNTGPMDSLLTGFENGPLVTYGYDEFFSGNGYVECGLAIIENGTRKCEPIDWVDDVFIVNNDLAYGVYDGQMIVYENGVWGPMPGPMINSYIGEIWANETYLFGVMQGGRIVMLHDGIWENLDTGTLKSFSSIWGFDETDVWAGTYNPASLYHFDGDTWNENDWEGDGCGSDTAIRDMWGSDGVLYFYTETAIGRVVNSKVEVLASFPCIDYDSNYEEQVEIISLWGNDPDDVYFLVRDGSFPRRECGVIYLLHYDGNTFHQI